MNTELQISEESLVEQIQDAKKASKVLATLSASEKNRALELMERELLESSNYILEANEKDLNSPENENLNKALKDRLRLDSSRIIAMAQGIRNVINIKDPINNVLEGWQHPNGMNIQKITTPLGVIGIIYEARPNVTTDAVALCLKSSNACVLRGSKQAWHTNQAIMTVIYRALEQSQIPQAAVQYLKDKSRESAKILLRAKDEVDLIIPRGGETLKKFITENSLVPVLGAGGGLCHTYIDADADPEKAVRIAINAKCQRPSVCNACETILIHSAIKDEVLAPLLEQLIKNDVEIVADQSIKTQFPFVELATDEDWATEYLDLKVSVKVVDSVEDAIEHINEYSTNHSESIITEAREAADKFKRQVDSACVYVNASTRFTDGEEFGFGAEIGISTGKTGIKGPIGAKDLTSYKYVIEGSGQSR